jgi:protein-disulfide isomerase
MRSEKRIEKETKKLTVPVNIGSDHIRGSINAPITLVEYGDYECPYTGMAYSIIKQIMKQFGDNIYTLYFATSPSMTYILMLSTQQRPLKLLQLKINSGKCMIIYLSIRKH